MATRINFLEKIQMPNVVSIFGAMLAGVDYIIMGAGIPREIPGVIDALSRGDGAQLKLSVEEKAKTSGCALIPVRLVWA